MPSRHDDIAAFFAANAIALDRRLLGLARFRDDRLGLLERRAGSIASLLCSAQSVARGIAPLLCFAQSAARGITPTFGGLARGGRACRRAPGRLRRASHRVVTLDCPRLLGGGDLYGDSLDVTPDGHTVLRYALRRRATAPASR